MQWGRKGKWEVKGREMGKGRGVKVEGST